MPSQKQRLQVAVIGAGPGGLAAAIHLLRQPLVSVQVFDKARELREVGAGIAINENTWRHLQLLGAAEEIEQFSTRGDGNKIAVEHRNGLTGKVLDRKYQSVDPSRPPTVRIERTKLQQALLSKLPQGFVQLSKGLSKIVETEEAIHLEFQDGTTAGPFDLVIGADGIRSVVRQHAFPEHRLSYTGKVAYRVLIPQSDVKHIQGIPAGPCFWHTKNTHVYTQPLDNGLFEIATRAVVSEEKGSKVSWGQEISSSEVVDQYDNYCDIIRQVVNTPKTWLEFAMFGGSRLESVVTGGRIALLGDASHPLSGAFGSGAAFAFEDAFVLAKALEEVLKRDLEVSVALSTYDAVRLPRYKDLYGVLASYGTHAQEAESDSQDENDYINRLVTSNASTDNNFIYKYDVTKVWDEVVKQTWAQ